MSLLKISDLKGTVEVNPFLFTEHVTFVCLEVNPFFLQNM